MGYYTDIPSFLPFSFYFYARQFSFTIPFSLSHTPRSYLIQKETRTPQPLPIKKITSNRQPPCHGKKASTTESCQETLSYRIYRAPLSIEVISFRAFSIFDSSKSFMGARLFHEMRALFKQAQVFSTRPFPRAPQGLFMQEINLELKDPAMSFRG